MGSARSVGSGSVRCRVTVWKPLSRTFTWTVDARTPPARSRDATPSDRARSVRSITSTSTVSTSKVCSWLTDFAAASPVTGDGSMPRARSCSVAPWAPRRRTRTSTGSTARSPIVRTPCSARTTRVCSPTPHRRRIGSGARKAASSPGRTTTRPSGFRRSEAILATSLVVGNADARGETDLVAHRGPDLAGDGFRWAEERLAPRHVEERLVDRDLLQERREAAQDLHHPAALAAVLRPVDREEGAAGAERRGGAEGHRRVDAEGAGLVAGGRDDAAGMRIAAHDHGPAAQLGPVALLDRREERVEVDVEDRGAGSHPPIIAAT